MARSEGVVPECCHHFFQAGQVRAAPWDDVTAVKEFSVQLLGFLESVRREFLPFMNRLYVFGFLGFR